jgi:hypothetical protein
MSPVSLFVVGLAIAVGRAALARPVRPGGRPPARTRDASGVPVGRPTGSACGARTTADPGGDSGRLRRGDRTRGAPRAARQHPPFELMVADQTKAGLPQIAGGLTVARASKMIDPKLKNPRTEHWERVAACSTCCCRPPRDHPSAPALHDRGSREPPATETPPPAPRSFPHPGSMRGLRAPAPWPGDRTATSTKAEDATGPTMDERRDVGLLTQGPGHLSRSRRRCRQGPRAGSGPAGNRWPRGPQADVEADDREQRAPQRTREAKPVAAAATVSAATTSIGPSSVALGRRGDLAGHADHWDDGQPCPTPMR